MSNRRPFRIESHSLQEGFLLTVVETLPNETTDQVNYVSLLEVTIQKGRSNVRKGHPVQERVSVHEKTSNTPPSS